MVNKMQPARTTDHMGHVMTVKRNAFTTDLPMIVNDSAQVKFTKGLTVKFDQLHEDLIDAQKAKQKKQQKALEPKDTGAIVVSSEFLSGKIKHSRDESGNITTEPSAITNNMEPETPMAERAKLKLKDDRDLEFFAQYMVDKPQPVVVMHPVAQLQKHVPTGSVIENQEAVQAAAEAEQRSRLVTPMTSEGAS